jgi:hypothetical protein
MMIRAEYVELARELPFLRSAFGLPCTDDNRADVTTTLAAFECIDRHYDALISPAQRRALGEQVVAVLATGAHDPALPQELADQVQSLHAVFARHAAAPRCAALLAEFVVATERVRGAHGARDYVRGVRAEGELTSAMVLLLLDSDARFAAFFLRLGVVGNLVDKLCDVRDDHARGEIAIAPSAGVHLRLAAAFARAAIPLVVGFPRPLALARWGLRYLRPLVA